MIKAEDLKIYDILAWHNKAINKDEYVQVKVIAPQYVQVSHLGEEGTWLIYYKDDEAVVPGLTREEILHNFRKNTLISVLLNCKLKAAGIDEDTRKLVHYEANFVRPDFGKYKKLLDI